MSKINPQVKSFLNNEFIQDISPETAANYSGGKLRTLTDVVLKSSKSEGGVAFRSNIAIKNLKNFGFDNATASISVNNNKKWRFYEDANFKGKFIEVGGEETTSVGKFGMKISSFRSVS